MWFAYNGGVEHELGKQRTYFPANTARDARLRNLGTCRIDARLRLLVVPYTGSRLRKLGRTLQRFCDRLKTVGCGMWDIVR